MIFCYETFSYFANGNLILHSDLDPSRRQNVVKETINPVLNILLDSKIDRDQHCVRCRVRIDFVPSIYLSYVLKTGSAGVSDNYFFCT